MPGNPQQHVPEHGRHRTGANVFGDAFDRRAGDTVFVHLRDIPPGHPGQGPAGRFLPVLRKRVGDGAPVVVDPALRQQHDKKDQLHDPAEGMVLGQPGGGPARCGARRDNENHHQKPAQGPVDLAAALPVELAVQGRDQTAEHLSRMAAGF